MAKKEKTLHIGLVPEKKAEDGCIASTTQKKSGVTPHPKRAHAVTVASATCFAANQKRSRVADEWWKWLAVIKASTSAQKLATRTRRRGLHPATMAPHILTLERKKEQPVDKGQLAASSSFFFLLLCLCLLLCKSSSLLFLLKFQYTYM